MSLAAAVVWLVSSPLRAQDAAAEWAGCAPVGVMRDGDALVIACAHGVAVVDAQTHEERWHARSRARIVGLERDARGEVVIVTARHQRLPLGAVPASERAARDERVGVVVDSRWDLVSVRVQDGAEVRRGDALGFVIERPEGEVRVATGVVESPPARGLARVRLALGDRAPVGAHARRIDEVDHHLWTPPRIADRVVFRAAIDGLIPVGTGGGAMLAVELAWHLEAPLVVRAGAAPVALGASNSLGGIFAGLGYASLGLDLDWMELSVGGAATTINQRARGQSTEAFAPLLGVRFGASEGFSAEAQLFFTIDDVGLDLGVGRLRLTLPITHGGARIVHRADIGRHGVLRVDGGLVLFLDGRGERGSIALGVFAGFGHLYYQRVCPVGECARAIVVSPSLGIELDWRL